MRSANANIVSRKFPTHRNLRDMMATRETQNRQLPVYPIQQLPPSVQVLDPRLYLRQLRLPNLPTLNERHRVDVRRDIVPRPQQSPAR